MKAKRRWPRVALACFGLSSAAMLASAGSPPKQDRSWKRYYNAQWGYCFSYPSRWRRGDAFEGAGLFVETGIKRQSNPLGEIDVAALGNTVNETGRIDLALVDHAQIHLEGLKKFERAEQMERLEQRAMKLLGNSALFIKARYYDPLERARWVDELVFTQRDKVLYRLELECRADQVNRFEPVFSHVLDTFQFDCGSKGER